MKYFKIYMFAGKTCYGYEIFKAETIYKDNPEFVLLHNTSIDKYVLKNSTFTRFEEKPIFILKNRFFIEEISEEEVEHLIEYIKNIQLLQNII